MKNEKPSHHQKAEEPATRISAPQNRSVGKSLCVVRLASAAKRKKLDLCPLKPPRAVNTLRAASFSAGFVLLGQNAVAQLNTLEHTNGVGE